MPKLESIQIGNGFSIRYAGRELAYVSGSAEAEDVINSLLQHCDYGKGFQAGMEQERDSHLGRVARTVEGRY